MVACLGLLYLSIGVDDAGAQMRRRAAPVKKAPAPIQKIAPTMQRPPALSIGPDFVLNACEIRCSKGGAFSTQLCQQEGYSDKFAYKVVANLRNAGNEAASIEQGWRVWGATLQHGSAAPAPAGSTSYQQAPTGGIYLAAGANYTGPKRPGIYNLENLAPGTHKIVFTADPDNHVAETDEGNNTRQCTLNIVAMAGPQPFDLTITNVHVSPSSGPPGTDFKFTVTVKNIGGDTFDGFNTSCQPGTGFNKAQLAANQTVTRTLSIPGTLTPGTKTIICDVDSQQPEQNTTNNTMSTTFTVTAP
jgi:subtilase family serine protease